MNVDLDEEIKNQKNNQTNHTKLLLFFSFFLNVKKEKTGKK